MHKTVKSGTFAQLGCFLIWWKIGGRLWSYKSLEVTGTGYEQKLVSSDNLKQKNCNKVKKSRETGED